MSARNFGVMTRNSELTSRRAATGISQRVGSRGVETQYNSHAANYESLRDSVIYPPMPSGSITPVPALKSLNLTQAVLDGLAAIFWVFFLAALFGSLPLAVALMFFAKIY